MPDILIQFHALRSELLTFVQKCVEDFDLYVTAFRFFPFEAKQVSQSELPELFSNLSPWEEFLFTVSHPVLPASSAGRFADANPDRMRLAIGRQTQKGLRQSILSARTSNAHALKIWRQAAKRLKALTKAGVVAVNPTTGASVKMRSFRYSPGAKALELQGVPIIQIEGGAVLKLGDENSV